MKIIITEKQKNNILKIITERVTMKNVAWYDPSFYHASHFWFPLTPKIVKEIYGDTKIKVSAFHSTDITKIKNLKTIIGNKKVISTFTDIDHDLFRYGIGIQTDGNILLNVVGDLVLLSKKDIMSVPDESGRRWVSMNYIFNNFSTYYNKELVEWSKIVKIKWGDTIILIKSVVNDYKKNKIKKIPTIIKKEINDFMTWYIPNAEKYFLEKIELIKSQINDKTVDGYNWDELLLKNITIKDVMIFKKTLDYEDQIKNLRITYDDMIKELENISNGNIYITDSDSEYLQFFLDRKKIINLN